MILKLRIFYPVGFSVPLGVELSPKPLCKVHPSLLVLSQQLIWIRI